MFEYDGRRLFGVCVAEKGVFRFSLSTDGRAGHASIPRIGDNALQKMAPVLAAMAERQPELELSPEPEALLGALGIDTSGDLHDAVRQIAEKDPRIAVLVEPMLGVTTGADDDRAPPRRST